jgi:hypothetical protein
MQITKSEHLAAHFAICLGIEIIRRCNMEVIQHENYRLLTSGILDGIIFGFVLQRGRYCMN